MANAQSFCELVYRDDCRIAASILKTAHILLAKSRNVAELFLSQGVCTENSNSDVVMVKPAEDRV